MIDGAGAPPPENGRGQLDPEASAQNEYRFEPVCRDPENSELPCPICAGMGVFAYDVPVNDPRFGKFQRCPNHPVEADSDMQERLRRYGNLQAYRDKTFASFDAEPTGGSYTQNVISSLRDAKNEGMAYAADPDGWLVYEGPIGCGKTHLAVSIANRRLERYGQQVIFITAPDLLDFLRTSFGSESETSYDDYFEQIRNVPLLVLDDLGVENPSPWAKEKMFQLLNSRHVSKLPTVITTSTELDEMDPWLSSRIVDASVVKHIAITAPDYRRTARSQSLDIRSINLQLYGHMRFDTFVTDSRNPRETASLKNAIELARNWALKPAGWLCLMGDYGTGKTHLAAAIANDLRERGKDALFYTVPDLLDFLRGAFNPKSHANYDKRFHDIVNIPILILDDLRTTSTSEWADEKLFQILDYRYLSRAATVFTTSETKEGIEEDMPRLATRLFDPRICEWHEMGPVQSFVRRTNKPS